MSKALYIFEFSRPDSDNEAEWFVGKDGISYEEQEELCYKHLNANVYEEWTLAELKDEAEIVAIYRVADDLINKVYKSRGTK